MLELIITMVFNSLAHGPLYYQVLVTNNTGNYEFNYTNWFSFVNASPLLRSCSVLSVLASVRRHTGKFEDC